LRSPIIVGASPPKQQHEARRSFASNGPLHSCVTLVFALLSRSSALVGADWFDRDFSDGDRLTLGPASPMSNAFSGRHVQGRYGVIAACSAGLIFRSRPP
jgi:hypothetical protein